MAEAGNRGSARSVEKTIAIFVYDINALAANGGHRILQQATMDSVHYQ
jgi:hypothetical protein